MAVLTPCSKSTNVFSDHSAERSCSRVTTRPSASSSRRKTWRGSCWIRIHGTPGTRSSPLTRSTSNWSKRAQTGEKRDVANRELTLLPRNCTSIPAFGPQFRPGFGSRQSSRLMANYLTSKQFTSTPFVHLPIHRKCIVPSPGPCEGAASGCGFAGRTCHPNFKTEGVPCDIRQNRRAGGWQWLE